MGKWRDQSTMSKTDLLQDVVTTVYNTRAHEKHDGDVRREASAFEDKMREALTGTVPSQMVIIVCDDILVFDKSSWLKMQQEYREIEERADRKDAAIEVCMGLRACA